jgi:hypothetical protein
MAKPAKEVTLEPLATRRPRRTVEREPPRARADFPIFLAQVPEKKMALKDPKTS